MKKQLTLFAFIFISTINAQVYIGTNTNNTINTSILINFEENKGLGLILPTVTSLPTTPAKGTFILDAQTSTKARIKMYNGTDWLDLSSEDGDATRLLNTRVPTPVEMGKGVIIGAETSSKDGVLVLESSTQAMVLPTVTDINTIIDPSPGMMVYYKKSATESFLAFFNGSKWSFWKP